MFCCITVFEGNTDLVSHQGASLAKDLKEPGCLLIAVPRCPCWNARVKVVTGLFHHTRSEGSIRTLPLLIILWTFHCWLVQFWFWRRAWCLLVVESDEEDYLLLSTLKFSFFFFCALTPPIQSLERNSMVFPWFLYLLISCFSLYWRFGFFCIYSNFLSMSPQL